MSGTRILVFIRLHAPSTEEILSVSVKRVMTARLLTPLFSFTLREYYESGSSTQDLRVMLLVFEAMRIIKLLNRN